MSREEKRRNFCKSEPYCGIKSYCQQHESPEYGFTCEHINMSDDARTKISQMKNYPPHGVEYVGDDQIIFEGLRDYIEKIK